MAVHTMSDLLEHRDHVLEIARYVNYQEGTAVNASIECIDCGVVLVSIDANEFLLTEELNNNPWGEDEKYHRADWKYEVANGDTSLGYWDWVEHQKESEDK